MSKILQTFFIFLLVLISGNSYACSDCEYEACLVGQCACLPKGGCIIGAVVQAAGVVTYVPRLVVGIPDKAIEDISKTIRKSFDDTIRTIDKAGKDIEFNLDKSAKDTEKETQRFGLELEMTGRAIGKYVETHNQIFTEFDKNIDRVRQGKIVDAIWHAALAPIVVAEKSASTAILESSYLRAVGQVASTTYGGPYGAAAYAAWLTYRQTGDPSLALRTGILTGATSWANGAAATISDVGKRAIVTAAIGGTAVAAAGGDQNAVQQAFLQSGAMVLINDGYKRYTTHKMNPEASADKPAYCLSVNETGCTTLPKDAIVETDSQGNITKVDMRKVDPSIPAVGLKDHTALFKEKNILMTGFSKIPGMQAMAVFHDTWAIDWNMNALATPASILPAIYVTYVGFGAPLYENIRSTAVEDALKGDPNPGRSIASAFILSNGNAVDAFVEHIENGQVATQVTHFRKGEGVLLWCETSTGKSNRITIKAKSKFGIDKTLCIKKINGGLVFDPPSFSDNATWVVMQKSTGSQEILCSSLLSRNACNSVAESYVRAKANEKTAWYRSTARGAKESLN